MIKRMCGLLACLVLLVAGSVQAQSVTGSGKLLLTGLYASVQVGF